jgi:hypothetical protein
METLQHQFIWALKKCESDLKENPADRKSSILLPVIKYKLMQNERDMEELNETFKQWYLSREASMVNEINQEHQYRMNLEGLLEQAGIDHLWK